MIQLSPGALNKQQTSGEVFSFPEYHKSNLPKLSPFLSSKSPFFINFQSEVCKMVHKEAIIRGKVQGVFFRGSAREKAEELGVRGEVKNLPDGSVWLVAEGEEEAVNELIAWCYEGPLRAEVQEVIVKDGELNEYRDFRVTR